MNLAAILGFYVLGLGCLTPGGQSAGQQPTSASSASSTQPSQSSASVPGSQVPPAQSSEPTQPVPPPDGQTPSSTVPVKLSPTKRGHHKKTVQSNCSTALAATNTMVSTPAGAPNATATGSSSTGPTTTDTTTQKPCPPPKKVVRNGGSDEPSIQLVGGTPAEQSVHQRSTDQLTVATEQNLKKVSGRQLNPSQREMVSQIKQFMDQSKTAVAAGDLERGHNLALKAHLLSDELVKP
jgi:hypothetical protein